MAGAGLRVLALATSALPRLPSNLADAERHQTLLGLVGIVDPPRAEARDAVAVCQRAGIRVVMITGDHAQTALAIARRLGIATDGGSAVTGSELRTLTDAELYERVENVRVYARVSPEDKIRIVKALQARGEFVAMTGDGVNDAPALQRANIGVAMGQSGTDVARDAAAMVLLDDNFATIVAAVVKAGASMTTFASSSATFWRVTWARSSRCCWRRCLVSRSRSFRFRSCGSISSPTGCPASRSRRSRRSPASWSAHRDRPRRTSWPAVSGSMSSGLAR